MMLRMSSLPRARAGAALLLAGALAAACGTSDAGDPLAPSGPSGRLRLVNVIADTTLGRVNALLEGVPLGVNVTYGQSCPACLPSPANGLYAPVLTGSRSLVLRRTADTSRVVATIPLTVTAQQDQTMYAVLGTATPAAVTTFVTADDNQAPAAGQARVRVVHLSPAAGPVDVFVTAPNADLAAATPTIAGVPFRTASSYLSLAAGTYQVRLVPAGTAPAARTGAVALTASLTLAAGTNRTVVAADANRGGTPLVAFTLTDR